MDFKELISQIADRIDKLKDQVKTEEASKNAFIMPFISALGFDVFNPMEVVPEYIADVGIKKGEKVDYCLMKDGQPIILIECKHWDKKLSAHESQLFRYFATTKSKIAILTNGIYYQFYSDVDDENKMDDRPFLEFDIRSIKEGQINEIKKFSKESFDIKDIVNTANELKYSKLIKELLAKEFSSASMDFTKFVLSEIYDGRLTQKVMEQFRPIVQKCLKQFVTEQINDRLKIAIAKEDIQVEAENIAEEKVSEIVTTEDELQGFRIVQAIAASEFSSDIVKYKDTKSYFAINYKGHTRKPVCRLWFNRSTWHLGLFDKEKNETKHVVKTVEDIYNYSDDLIGIIRHYEGPLKEGIIE